MRTTNSAPYFSLARAAWIPCAIRWDEETGELVRVEGPEGFTTWREAEEAGFLEPVLRPARRRCIALSVVHLRQPTDSEGEPTP